MTAQWTLRLAGSAEKDLAQLAPKAAAAVVEFMLGPLTVNPRRVGKALRRELAGRYSARRGPYRVIYELDEPGQIVRVLHIDHRADVYPSR